MFYPHKLLFVNSYFPAPIKQRLKSLPTSRSDLRNGSGNVSVRQLRCRAVRPSSPKKKNGSAEATTEKCIATGCSSEARAEKSKRVDKTDGRALSGLLRKWAFKRARLPVQRRRAARPLPPSPLGPRYAALANQRARPPRIPGAPRWAQLLSLRGRIP